VGKVTSVGEIHAQNRIPGLQKGEVGRHVCLGTGMRLDIGIRRMKKPIRALDSQFLCQVDALTPPVVTPVWIAFGIFVCQDTGLGGHNGTACNVLRGNQIQFVGLSLNLRLYDPSDFRVGLSYDFKIRLKLVFFTQCPSPQNGL
jgi:hypothetical protein